MNEIFKSLESVEQPRPVKPGTLVFIKLDEGRVFIKPYPRLGFFRRILVRFGLKFFDNRPRVYYSTVSKPDASGRVKVVQKYEKTVDVSSRIHSYPWGTDLH